MAPTVEQVKEALIRVQESVAGPGCNFSGTTLDDVWIEQMTRIATEYIDSDDFSIFLEADEKEMLGGQIVAEAVDIILDAFMNSIGYKRS